MLHPFYSPFLQWACCGAFSLLLLSACAASVGSDPAPVSDAEMSSVERLIGTAACSTDADCRTVALGEKACGGPILYRAWSSRRTDPQALASAAARYTTTQRARPDASVMASNCARVDDPGARCAAPPPENAASAGSLSTKTGRCELARERSNMVR